VLGGVGVLIVLGAMLGKLLADSGAADEVVDKILTGGRRGLPWRMALIAFVIGIPMFFEIGLVLLIPVVMLAVHRSRRAARYRATPALAGLSVLHGFIPPHPGPLAAIANLNGNVGTTLALGLLIAIPTVIIAGPLFALVAARWVPIGAQGAGGNLIKADAGRNDAASRGAGTGDAQPGNSQQSENPAIEGEESPTRHPGFAATLFTILAPVVLMLARAAADVWMSEDAWIYPFVQFIGEPVVALLLA